MIAQLLNREFLLSELAAAQTGLAQELTMRERRGRPGPLDEYSDTEIQAIIDMIAAVADTPEGLVGATPMEEGEFDAPGLRPKDDFGFVPRDPLLSILQTAFEDTVETREPEAITQRPLLDDRRSGDVPVITDRQLASVRLYRTPDGRRLWKPFEVARPKVLSDPRWVWAGVIILWNRQNNPAPFNATPPAPIPVADNARILLVGDWGSGLPRAQAVARHMRHELDDGIAARREQHVIHLGDVYYTGGEREYRERFLKHWPVAPDEDIGSYSLNGNHDMYQGGHAYFGTCLADARFARQERSSFFALRSTHWQLLGLDTSYEDAGLYGEQAQWALARLDESPDLRTVLLSHHQPFSAYEPGAGVLRQKIAPVLETNRIDAWFWGHEHRCLVYEPHMKIGFSSCVGHGGIPEYLIAREGTPYREPLRYDYRRRYGNGPEPWDTFGFAVLDLDGDAMSIRYIDEHGECHHEERIDARPGRG